MSKDRQASLERAGAITFGCLGLVAVSNFLGLVIPGDIGWIPLLLPLVTGVWFLVWFRLAYIAAHEIAPTSFEGLGSFWAVGSWFFPLLNFVFPFVIARRIWAAFAQQAGVVPEVPGYFTLWWGFCIVCVLTVGTNLKISGVASIAAAILCAGVVKSTTALYINSSSVLRSLDGAIADASSGVQPTN